MEANTIVLESGQLQDTITGLEVLETLTRKRKRCHYYNADRDLAGDDAERETAPPATKYRDVEASVQFQLEEFSDEVLCEIFQYLDSWALLALMRCCDRFHVLIRDRRFWHHIDLIKDPLSWYVLEDVLERTHANTRCLKLQGSSPTLQHIQEMYVPQFHRRLVDTLSNNCLQLRVLELQCVTLDFKHIRVFNFPKTLKRLILNECPVLMPEGAKSIFSGIDGHLTDLEELGIEYNDWFEPYYIMIFSKLPALRWLSLKGCKQLLEFVPYGSMAARFGFKCLEYLDVRFTPITDSDLQCFNAVLTLKEVLLDCPMQLLAADEAKSAQQTTESEASECADVAGADGQASTLKAATINTDVDAPSTSTAAAAAAAATAQSTSSSSPAPAAANSAQSVSSSSAPAAASTAQSASSSSTASTSAPVPIPTSAERQQHLHAFGSSSSSSSSSSSASFSPFSSSSSSSSPIASPPSPYREPVAMDGLPVAGGNAPPRSRFLPRSAEVIYVDFQNLHRPFRMHGAPPRRPPNNQVGNNQLDNVLNHPLFWDIMNPLSQQRGSNEGNREVSRSRRCFLYNRRHGAQRSPISDRSICCFGRPRNPVEMGVIWIHVGNRPSENSFRRLSVRNYKLVTDISLQHLKQCSPHLVFLDLSGTNVSREGLKSFKESKPECQIVADHLSDVPSADSDSAVVPADN